MEFDPGQTLHSALGLDPDSQTDPALEVESLAMALSQHPNDTTLQAKYDHALARLSTFDLPFKGDAALRPAGVLSYGERARLQLALLVAQGCTFLILDEPINHLDIPSREHFEEALENFNGTILAIVHDRSFIERFATDVWIAKEGKILK